MSLRAEQKDQGAAREMPRGIKWALTIVVVALAGGGLMLLTARGEAILIDLYAAAQQMLCF